MSRKILAALFMLTMVNVAVFVLNVSPAARAALAGASYKELMGDAAFTHAVKTVVEACHVNLDIARVTCR
jgi:hypothetical protein